VSEAKWRFPELESWIVVQLCTSLEGTSSSRVNPTEIIKTCPQSLAIQIPDDQHVIYLLHYMESPLGLLTRTAFTNFQISTNGILYFRKYLSKIQSVAHDKKRIAEIIDKTEGTEETKKQFKKFLEKVKDEPLDDFHEHMVDFLKRVGVEGVFYVVRIIHELVEKGL